MRNAALAAIGGLALVGVARARSNGTSCRWPRASSASTRLITAPTSSNSARALEELEYKLGLNEGDSIVYQWDAVDLKIPSCCTPSSTATRRRSTTPAT